MIIKARVKKDSVSVKSVVYQRLKRIGLLSSLVLRNYSRTI